MVWYGMVWYGMVWYTNPWTPQSHPHVLLARKTNIRAAPHLRHLWYGMAQAISKEDKMKLEPSVAAGYVGGSTTMVWYGMVWYGMVDVCDGYLAAEASSSSSR